MSKLVLVTGGQRSGKSKFAEALTKKEEAQLNKRVCYIATSIAFDDEMRSRVKAHQRQRPERWTTIEESLHPSESLVDNTIYLLDCVTGLVSNIIFSKGGYDDIEESEVESVEREVYKEIDALVSCLRGLDSTIIAVTNEIGMGIIPMGRLARLFVDAAGRVNQRLAQEADEVYLVVSSIPMKIK